MLTPAIVRRLVSLGLAACALAIAPVLPGHAADQGDASGRIALTFRATADDGNPVVDLKPADVTIRINGRPREVRALDLVRLGGGTPAAPAAALPAPFASNTVEPGRDVLLAVDDDSIAPGKETLFREAASTLLGQLAPGDRAGLLSLRQGGASVAFTAQTGAVRTAVAALVGGAASRETSDNFVCRGRRVLDAVSGLLSAAPPDRQQVVVLLSSSMSGPVTERRQTLGTQGDLCQLNTANFQQFNLAANASAAALYVVQLVEAQGAVDGVDTQSLFAGLEAIAAAAGHDIIRPGSGSSAALGRILRETSAYYVASFDPDPAERTGTPLRVELKLARERVKVQSRPEIVIPKADARARAAPRDMLRVATVYRDLALRATAISTHNPDGNEVKVIALFEPGERGTRITAASVGLFDEKSTLKKQWTAQDTDLARAPVIAALTAPPGKYRMRVAAVDATGRAGTTDYEFTAGLTPAGPLKLSTLSLGTNAGGAFGLKLLYTTDAAVIGYLEISGVPKGGNVAVKFEIAAADTAPPMGTADAVLRPGTTEDVRNAYGGFPIDTLEPGDYQLRAIVTLDGKPAGSVARTFRKGR